MLLVCGRRGWPVSLVGAQHEYHVLDVHWVGVTVIHHIVPRSSGVNVTGRVHVSQEMTTAMSKPLPLLPPPPSPEQGTGEQTPCPGGSAETAAPKQLGEVPKGRALCQHGYKAPPAGISSSPSSLPVLAEKRTECQARDLGADGGPFGITSLSGDVRSQREGPSRVRTKAELGEDLRNKLSGAVTSGPANGQICTCILYELVCLRGCVLFLCVELVLVSHVCGCVDG